MRLPDGVLGMADRDETWAAWVDGLAATAEQLLEEWQLRQAGANDPPMHGWTALVLPVSDRDGARRVLKIAFPDDETAHEHLALRAWGGDGAVRLVRADPRRRALLLDRLAATDLAVLDDVEACEVVAGLYGRLHRPAPPQLERLSTRVVRWADALRTLPRSAPLPHRLVEQAASLAEAFAADDATDGRLLHGDLHYANVLAVDETDMSAAWSGAPDAWLAIDPKPLSGDPHAELAPMLWNRWDEVLATGDVRGAVRRRFHALVDAAWLDEDRARDWVVVQETVRAAWLLTEEAAAPGRGGRGSGLGTQDIADRVTAAVSIAKAVQE